MSENRNVNSVSHLLRLPRTRKSVVITLAKRQSSARIDSNHLDHLSDRTFLTEDGSTLVTQLFAGKPSAAQRHQFDYALYCPELRSVDFTVAANDNSSLQAGDATAAPLSQNASVCGAEASRNIAENAPADRTDARRRAFVKKWRGASSG
jgi:hypothetical protein